MHTFLKPIQDNPLSLKTEQDCFTLAKSIQVAVPYNASVNPTLMDCCAIWQAMGIAVRYYRNSGGFLEIVRQNIMYDFLDNAEPTRSFLMMVDADVVPQRQSPLVLAASCLAVNAGVYPIISDGLCTSSFTLKEIQPGNPVPVPRNGLIEVDWTGFGLVAIRRDVLRVLREREAEHGPAFFIPDTKRREAALSGTIGVTEDRIFCERAKLAGFQITVNLAVRADHLKVAALPIDQMVIRTEK